eukprot:m.33642 g.33642  ORF g.33642 m.33642 type:complete len:288 (-) comp16850_c0_seq1:168-1031(-)
MATAAPTRLLAPSVKIIGLGWCGFIAENLILSENRTEIIAKIGDDNYHHVYNTLSTTACSAIAYGYYIGRKKGPQIRIPGVGSKVAAFGLQAVGLGIAAQFAPKFQIPVMVNVPTTKTPPPTPPTTTATTIKPSGVQPVADDTVATAPQQQSEAVAEKKLFQVRCPMDFTPADVPQDGIYGVKRITRHAMFWSFGMVSLGFALRTRFMSEVVMFTMPAVFAAVGGLHQDSRYRRGMGGQLPKEIDEVTSSIPFVALAMGRQSWRELANEIKTTNAALAVALAALLAL